METNFQPLTILTAQQLNTAFAGCATPADIAAAINLLKGATPSTLNTLQKIAAAINNDPNYHQTVNALIDGAVASAVAGLVDSSPASLNTLNELAAALGDDPNFATTITNALAGKQASMPNATQSEMEAGTEVALRGMSPLRVKQAIAALAVPNGSVNQVKLATGVAGTGPAFSVYQSSVQGIPNGTLTKVNLQAEEYDTNNNFDSSSNYRFQPSVAGYYQINGCVSCSGSMWASVFKNGLEHKRGPQQYSTGVQSVDISALIYLNGSSDYVELYVYQFSGGTQNTTTGAAFTWFNGYLARAA